MPTDECILCFNLQIASLPVSLQYYSRDSRHFPVTTTQETASCAAKESSVEHKLEAVRGTWSCASFKFVRHSSKGGVMLDKKHTTNLAAELDDARMVLAALQSNQFRYPFERDIIDWLRRLTIAGEVIDQWMNLQGLWMYLEVVFTSGDVAKQLPQETKRFAQVCFEGGRICNELRLQPTLLSQYHFALRIHEQQIFKHCTSSWRAPKHHVKEATTYGIADETWVSWPLQSPLTVFPLVLARIYTPQCVRPLWCSLSHSSHHYMDPYAEQACLGVRLNMVLRLWQVDHMSYWIYCLRYWLVTPYIFFYDSNNSKERCSSIAQHTSAFLAVSSSTAAPRADISRCLNCTNKQVHRTWSKMMASSAEHPDVLKLCVGDTTVHTLLPQLQRQLELCQSSLSGFLSIKRDLFPRFYFVSDPLLLEVIGAVLRWPRHSCSCNLLLCWQLCVCTFRAGMVCVQDKTRHGNNSNCCIGMHDVREVRICILCPFMLICLILADLLRSGRACIYRKHTICCTAISRSRPLFNRFRNWSELILLLHIKDHNNKWASLNVQRKDIGLCCFCCMRSPLLSTRCQWWMRSALWPLDPSTQVPVRPGSYSIVWRCCYRSWQGPNSHAEALEWHVWQLTWALG